MTLALAFWITFLVVLILTSYNLRGGVLVSNIAFFILIGLLGWAVFGSAIHH
jgi:hypothetical protein